MKYESRKYSVVNLLYLTRENVDKSEKNPIRSCPLMHIFLSALAFRPHREGIFKKLSVTVKTEVFENDYACLVM